MDKGIKVKVKTQKKDPAGLKADLLVIGVFSDGMKKSDLCCDIDAKLGMAVTKIFKLGDFTAKEKTTSLLYTQGKAAAERLLLVGLGESKKANVNTFRTAAAIALDKAVELQASTVAAAIHQAADKKDFEPAGLGQAITEGAYFGAYRFNEYFTKKDNALPGRIEVIIADQNAALLKKLGRGIKAGNIIGQAQSYARSIANRPANVVNPHVLAAEARRLAQSTPHLTCRVLDDRQLKEKKMGGILAVGQGSVNKPRLIVLKYTPSVNRAAAKRIIGLVGKAITFDSGGISLKPGEGMQDMKFDKSGGIAVLGAMRAIAGLEPAVVVYGIIPCAENMPSGSSYRPGDIITTYSGRTVEIQNTDAEGRMLLCDAINYAVELKCDTIVDIATLTGACVVALGQNRAGLMGNDDTLIEQLQAAAESSGEHVWHLPSDDEYIELMKSKVADLKNIGGKWAGACTAAAFLGQFVGDAKWAHLDIAGTGVFGGEKNGAPGSRGFGVRLLTEYVMNVKK